MARSTLCDGPAEQTPGSGHREQCGDAHPASRFAKNGDVTRVTAEGSDVILHPRKRSDLVKQTEVGVPVTQVEETIRS